MAACARSSGSYSSAALGRVVKYMRVLSNPLIRACV